MVPRIAEQRQLAHRIHVELNPQPAQRPNPRGSRHDRCAPQALEARGQAVDVEARQPLQAIARQPLRYQTSADDMAEVDFGGLPGGLAEPAPQPTSPRDSLHSADDLDFGGAGAKPATHGEGPRDTIHVAEGKQHKLPPGGRVGETGAPRDLVHTAEDLDYT
eukprot:scaffold25.g5105.t1